MMTYKEALLFVCKCLTTRQRPERIAQVLQAIRDKKVVWEQIVQVSSDQFVLPALFLNLKKASLLDELPPDLVEYLEYLTDCNRERNQQIMSQVNDITALLNEHGIAPVFLKGTAHLLTSLYDDIAERMVGDIDFLVEEEKMIEAAQILIAVGYKPLSLFHPEQITITKHYPRLTNFNYPAAVEVHRQVIVPPNDKHFKGAEIIKNKQLIFSELEMYIPSNEHLIIHNVLNTQVNDKAYLLGNVHLRQMYDLLLLANRENPYTVLTKFTEFSDHSNACLAIISILFDFPVDLNYTNNWKVKFILKRDIFFISNSRYFHSIYKIIIYLFIRLSRYATLPIQSVYRKDMRASLWIRISEPNWYKNHFLSYWKYFKSVA